MKIKRIAGVCLILLFLLLPHINAAGEKALDIKDYIPGGEEGENVSVNTDKENGRLTIQFSFDQAGYHTVTAFQNNKQKLKKEKGVRFSVENLTKDPARMNMAVIGSDGTVFQVGDGRYVRLISEEESYSLSENGCFELPGGFVGEVEIPFELFSSDFGEMDTKSVKELTGYGMVCVTEGEAPFHLVFSQMAFVNGKKMKDAKESAFLTIEGPDTIQKSNVGESKERYTAVVYNMLGEGAETKAAFSSEESTQEILADDEGWVTVPPGLSLDSFFLEAVTPEGMKAKKEIGLTESWTRQVLTENGYDASIAPPAEIASVEGDMAVFTEEAALWLIRVLFAAGVLILFAYYAFVRNKNCIRRE
ncbi:MAG: hypothetical protein NC307_05125 [Roseburia sp.]|nr:hypothetical protein [Roseburia sp.]